VKVTKLHRLPSSVLAQRARKNEPWPQSCWMMKIRTTSPAASSAASSVAQ